MDAYRNIVEFNELSSIGIYGKKPVRLSNARGVLLRVESGSIWITEENCTNDAYVRAGDSYRIEHDGLTLVSAVKGPVALVTLDPTIPVQPTLPERLWTLWAALYAPESRPTTAGL